MLRAVERETKHQGGIAEHQHCGLEQTLLAFPLWLQINGHEMEARRAVELITKQSADLFTHHRNQALFTIYQRIADQGVPANEVWIEHHARECESWSTDPDSRDSITSAWLAVIGETGSCAMSMEVEGTAKGLVQMTIRELCGLAQRRQTIHAVEDLYAAAVKPPRPGGNEEIDSLIEAVDEVHRQRPIKDKTVSLIGPMLDADLRLIERISSGEVQERCITTGFPQLDQVTGGFTAGNLIVIAARPAMGKTSLALDMALHAAQSGIATAYFSFEMTAREILRRLVSKLAKIDVLRMRHGRLEEWQLDTIRDVQPRIADLPLFIEEQNLTPAGIERRIREINRLIHPGKIEIVAVDHLQLAGARDTRRYETRSLQLGNYSGQLKTTAKELGLAVIALSQLNRQVEARPLDQRAPRLSDLRESGAIEQDADAVLGLHRRFLDTQDPGDAQHAELTILKNRSGPTGRIALQWLGNLAKFISADNGGGCDGRM